MPLLFALAGISTAFALQKRTVNEYAKERVGKLLIPLSFGMLLLIPVQSFIAGLSFNETANYFDYFKKLTDLSGYDGGFTPGHLWFLAFLFVISMICIPIIIMHRKNADIGKTADKCPIFAVVLMGVVPLSVWMIKIGGEGFGAFAADFLLGYFVLSREEILKKLDKYRFLLLVLMIAGYAWGIHSHNKCQEFFSWINIITVIGFARHYLDFSNKTTAYLANSSFGIYVFHQSWIVIIGFNTLKLIDSVPLQIAVIMISSIVVTFVNYEVFRRFKIFRFMFGINNKRATAVRDSH